MISTALASSSPRRSAGSLRRASRISTVNVVPPLDGHSILLNTTSILLMYPSTRRSEQLMTIASQPDVTPAEPTEDPFGAIEAAGVEYLPEDARDSRPRNLGAVFLGANLTWTNVVFGAFAILFGLSFWQTVTSMAVGTAVGTLGVLPTAIIGPRTGTNMTVSSGAFFGIRGRFIGSGLALAIALGFAAVTVWTSGDALVAAGHRLLGTPENNAVHAIAYAAVAALMVTVALYGHATIVAMQKVVVPVVGVLMILGVFAFAGGFDPGASSGE